MAKLVILKSFMESYYDNMIEKSTTHKYIRRVPKSTGKGYNYFYPEDFKKPIKALLSFFGMKEDKIDNAYKNNNIQEAYGVTKQGFAQHVLEYLTNRKTWNTFFANKANRDRYKVPEKPVKETEKVKVEEKVITGGKTTEKVTVEEKETKEKNFKSTWNRSLMRKIYSMYNAVPEDKTENKPGIDTIKVGDTVSYNGRTGKVTKDFENGMMFVNFENGGMGRFAVKDLQKMNPTAEEVTETATENAAEQNVNGTNEAVQEEVSETIKENPYNSVGAEIVKDYQTNLDNIRNSYDEKKKNYIFSNEVIPNLIRIALRTAVKTSDTIDEVPQKTELIVDAIKQNMPEEERKLFLDYDFNSLAQIEWKASGKGNVQPVEKPGYNKVERAAITILYQKYKKENPELRDYQIYEKIKENVPDLDKKGNLLKTMTVVKNLIFDKELVPDVVNYIQENEIKETAAEEHENRSQAMMGNDNAKKLGAIEEFENGWNFKLQPETKEKLLEQMSEYTIDALSNTMSEFTRNITDFTRNNLEESIISMNERIAKEKHPLIKLYNEVKRDYLISLKDEQKQVETATEEKPGYTEGEKAAIALAYRKEKDFDPTLSDYAYYEKIKAKFPDLAEKGELYSTMLEVKDMMFNESKFNAAREYLTSLTEKEKNQPETENTTESAEISTEPKNDAIDYYVSGDGMWINKYLRNPEQFAREGGNVTEEEKQIIAELDKETTSTPINEKKLYRSVDASAIFGDISDGDFDDIVARVVYGNDDKLLANKVGVLINRAENSQITEPGFMSTTKDKEIAENWDGFTGSNKEVVLELDIPEGMTGKDLAAYDIEGEEQKEVLLPRNTDYFIKKIKQGENGKILVQAQVLGVHGNHIAMLGNQNARKYGLSEEEELEYNKEYNWYKDTYVDGTRENNPYSNEEETIENILKDEADERFKVYGENDIAYLALKDLYADTTGKEYTPPAVENTAEPKPLTEKQTKEEEKEYKEAREQADLPKIGINYGDRISAMEDAVSLNPNDVNYAYQDTGYIAGSQKEKIQDFWKRKRESGEGTTIEEIDWTSLEENPRYAEQQITKANILGDIDYNAYKEKGMDSRTAYLISRVFAAIPKEPVGHDVTARKNYVIAVNTIKDRLGECKTINEVKEFVDDVYGEYKQTFDSQILRVPEVKKLKAERDAIILDINKIRNDVMEWGRNELLPKYRDLGKKERKAVWRYREEMKKEIAAKIRELDPNFDNPDMYVEIDTSNMWWPINIGTEGILEEKIKTVADKLRAAKAKAKDDIMKDNVTHDVWKELGAFAELRFSKSFQNHVNNLKVYDEKYRTNPNGETTEAYQYKYRDKEYDKYENWDWIDAKKNKVARKESEIIKGKKKRTFEMIVPKTIERKGGRDISVKSTADLKKAFNLRDVQTGTYVQSDPASAKWHVDNIAAGLADLADVLGIKDEQISLNGRLALSIGARGHGGALAHYEPVERVINITKFRGGGSLGHEWFHSFDNMIAEAITGGNVSVYMSDPNRQSKVVKLMDAFKPEAYHDAIPDNELSLKVRDKFINLVNAMMTGDTPETEVVVYDKEDVTDAKNFFENQLPRYTGSYYDRDGFYKKLSEAKTLDEAISAINEKFKNTVMLIRENRDKVGKLGKYEQKRMKEVVKTYEKYRVMAAAYFDPKEAKADGGEVTVKTGRTVSRFYEDAKKLDEGKQKPYWSTPLEMAARGFEAYLVDKLKEKGQRNDYLSGSANNDVYAGAWYPYPTERDRIKINKAFDELFEVIRSENAIRKALDILDKPKFIIKNGRFLIRK